MLFQIVLGFVINRLFDPNRFRIPFHDELHWYLGRCLVFLGCINIPLGLSLYSATMEPVSNALYVLFALWILVASGALSFGARVVGREPTHHVAPKVLGDREV